MPETKVSKEEYAKMLECKTVAELQAYCKTLGHELSQEEAEKILAQNAERELSLDNIENVAGGFCVGAVSIACLGVGVA